MNVPLHDQPIKEADVSEYTTIQPMQQIPYGYCQCGCGRKTEIATRTRSKRGVFKGKPNPFYFKHGGAYRWPQRFWKNVDKSGECWMWTAGTNKTGKWAYGSIVYQGKRYSAHRISYELAYGPIPDGLDVLHKCDTPDVSIQNIFFLGRTLTISATA